jgi:hypothetical protein
MLNRTVRTDRLHTYAVVLALSKVTVTVSQGIRVTKMGEIEWLSTVVIDGVQS